MNKNVNGEDKEFNQFMESMGFTKVRMEKDGSVSKEEAKRLGSHLMPLPPKSEEEINGLLSSLAKLGTVKIVSLEDGKEVNLDKQLPSKDISLDELFQRPSSKGNRFSNVSVNDHGKETDSAYLSVSATGTSSIEFISHLQYLANQLAKVYKENSTSLSVEIQSSSNQSTVH